MSHPKLLRDRLEYLIEQEGRGVCNMDVTIYGYFESVQGKLSKIRTITDLALSGADNADLVNVCSIINDLAIEASDEIANLESRLTTIEKESSNDREI